MRHPFVFCAMLVAAAPLTAAASTPDADSIPWRDCRFDETGWAAPTLANRLQCGSMQVPLDHRHPMRGDIDVGLIRVLAGERSRRAGAIFFNFGGPGGNPRKFLPAMADWWNRTDATDPVAGKLRTLADRYDLIAVVPRGLAGGRVHDCLAGRTETPFNNLSADQSDANWAAAEQDATSLARDCSTDPFFRAVDTEQHVHDTEFARRLFGDQPLHFYGTSYGTWVGAWYAAMYPEHVGRMVFDSTMDVTHDLQDAVYTQVQGLHELFLVDAVRPALRAPGQYELGTDEAALLERVRAMPARARGRWLPGIDSPADLAAALVMSEWFAADATQDQATVRARIASYSFSTHGETNRAIQAAATRLLVSYFTDTPSAAEAFLGTDGGSVYLSVVCNDTPWTRGSSFWRARSLDMATRFPGGSSSEAHTGLVCSNWPGRTNARPDMAPLGTVPTFLMLQAEYDPATSLADASRVLATYNNARMVMVRGLHGHGVLKPSAAPCIQSAVGGYLLNGEAPEAKLTACNLPHGRTPRAVEDPLRKIDEHLKRLFQAS